MRSVHVVLLGCFAALGLTRLGLADDFRIQTKVYAGKEKKPVSQNVTLFQAGYVYDYLSDPERVAVFDQAHGRFILLDPSRKVKVEIKTGDVLVFSQKSHDWAAQSSNAFLKFAADPQFEVAYSDEGELMLGSQYLSYRVETVPASTPKTSQQYREFSDWYARFNSMYYVGSTPPFPRLEVNRELAERGLIPTQVAINIPAQRTLGVRGVSMHTEHRVSWRLLQRDLERIAETANQLAAFETVDLREFQAQKVSKR